MPNEFDIIAQYFTQQSGLRPDVTLGSGDDCALLRIPPDHELAVSIDTLVVGVHFSAGDDPFNLGHKALAVNLSDLAAMGAEPAWITLALTLPKIDENWLTAFSKGFFTLAQHYNLQLVGGDLTRGPLSITIQAHGFIPSGMALRRSGANPGDVIYVTGTLGDAGLALQCMHNNITAPPAILQRLNHPEPRIAAGLALRNIASSAIDISDGLAADLAHILDSSGVGAVLNVDSLPFSYTLKNSVKPKEAAQLALSSGDDYELCFTVPKEHEATLATAFDQLDCSYHAIGHIELQPGLRIHHQDGTVFKLDQEGFLHF